MVQSAQALMQDVNSKTMQLTGNKFIAGMTDIPAAGTRVLLLPANQKTIAVWIRPKPANVGDIYVGTVTVDATHGLIMAKTDPAVVIYVDNSQTPIYVDAATNGDDVSYLAWYAE